MAKQRSTSSDPFGPDIRARLQAIGPYEARFDAGYGEILFGSVPCLASDLAKFELSWYLHAPKQVTPVPDNELFALWERYRAAHLRACDEYRRLLFDLYSQSAQAGYDEREWRQLRRTPPTEGDLSSVLKHADVSLHQVQAKASQPPECEVQVSFGVFWDEHGVAMRLREANGEFTVVEWTGIGDL